MVKEISFYDLVKLGFGEVADRARALNKAIAKGQEQTETRDGVIQTINEMCDALQKATDAIASELSGSIVDFNSLGRMDDEAIIRGFFDRTAEKLSDKAIRKLLREGLVCGELHKIGDRYTQPLSHDTMGGVSFWENVKTFFIRTNRMSDALDALATGERDYIKNTSEFLNEVRDKVEDVTTIPRGGGIEILLDKARELVRLMREKRNKLESQMRELRMQAETTRKTLH
jgi:hypothetical protein